MQTPKSKPGTLDVPRKPSTASPRAAARKLKTPGSEPDSVSSPNPLSKTPKTRSPKVVDRRSPRSPAIEKKRPIRVPELEPQLSQLQEELKTAKEELSSSDSLKSKAQQEAEEAKKQLAAVSAELEETQKQLKDLSDSDETRVQELRKISQDRDRAWQSELDAVQNQQSMDSSALASAMNEIQRLKIQLERVSESETSQARHAESAHGEIQSLRIELTETLDFVEKLKNLLNETRESEAQALEEVSRAQLELEVVKTTEESLQSEHADAMQKYESLLVELEKSQSRVKSLEELVENLQSDLANNRNIDDVKISSENGESDELKLLKPELANAKHEVDQLKSALEAAEKRYHDEYIQSTLQIRKAYEDVESAKSESRLVEAELEAKLKESRAEVEDLKMKLIKKETDSQSLGVEENDSSEKETELELELWKSESVLEELRASLLEKETMLQNITQENELLKSEITKRETEQSKANDEVLALADEARMAEREALTKVGYLTEEAEKNFKKAAWMTEQFEATQAANSEMEAELRKLKVQSDQWRKAAEAAASMLSTGNNGKFVERTGSMDYHTIGGRLSSPYLEEMDDDSPKKKNGNMLRKIGVLLKKGQK